MVQLSLLWFLTFATSPSVFARSDVREIARQSKRIAEQFRTYSTINNVECERLSIDRLACDVIRDGLEVYTPLELTARETALLDASGLRSEVVQALALAFPSKTLQVGSEVRGEVPETCGSDATIVTGEVRELVTQQIEALRAGRDRLDAIRILAESGSAAVRPLIEELRNPKFDQSANRTLQRDAATALGWMGPTACAAVPILTQYLGSLRTGEASREPIIEAIGNIGPSANEAVPTLIAVLQERGPVDSRSDWKSSEEQHAVIVALGLIGPPAYDVAPFLARYVRESPPFTRRDAVHSLWRVGGCDSTRVLPTLLKALDDREYYVRATAARSIGECGPWALSALPKLDELSRTDPEYHVRTAASKAVYQIASTTPADQ